LENPKRKKQAKILRSFRKIHRYSAISLLVFFFIMALSGLLLGWKKHSGELLQAKTYTGTSSELNEWLSIDSLNTIATMTLLDSISPALSFDLDRIDIRKEKGAVKFIYKNHYWGIQLDGVTGKVMRISRRRSDFIESLHDGSLLDSYLGTNDIIKLLYSTIMGLALTTFTVTGFWLWYGPKRMKHLSRKHK